MAVSTASNQTSVVLTSTTQAIPISFPFFDEDDLVVIRTDQTTLGDTTLSITTHYTISGGEGNTGTVTMIGGAANVGDTITVYRSIPYTQTTELEEGDPLPSSALEQRLDRLTIQIQQVKAIAERALRLGETSPAIGAADLKDPTSKFLAFDANDRLTGYTAAQAAALLALSGETNAVAVWADDAARTLEVPTVVGQLGIQLDTGDLYRAIDLVAGSWTAFDMLLAGNNLSDLDDVPTARTNLGALSASAGAVDTANLAANAVTTAKITDGNVTADKLSGAAVTTAKLSNLNVTEGKLADGAVATAKMADNAVTLAKLQQLAAFSLLLNNTSGTANPTNSKVSDLTEESAPGDGDWLLGEESSGALRKINVATLQSTDFDHTADGYQIFTNGLILQWGTESGSGVSVSFPKTFPNAVFAVVGTADAGGSIRNVNCSSLSATGFTGNVVDQSNNLASNGWTWIAVGN